MSNVFGENIKLSIFGESHGVGVGMTLSGFPAGIEIDFHEIDHMLSRRKPGSSQLTTKRKEDDQYEVLSGIFEGYTTGAPVTFFIRNKDMRSKDYSKTKDMMRPGHADYTGFIKYNGYNDYRGGGHFSARVTAPLVIAGAICQSFLKQHDIFVGTRIKSIEKIREEAKGTFVPEKEQLNLWQNSTIPVIDEKFVDLYNDVIKNARDSGDSVGGQTETYIIGAKAGLGNPFFDSLESRISHLAFSIPGVKGIEFGAGFDMTRHYGSEMNDAFYMKEGKVQTKTNHNGGINGGISNGMPVVFSLAFKPTPSIFKEQNTINIQSKENTTMVINGRHDPCILLRGVPIVDSIAAIVIADELLGEVGKSYGK